MEELSTAVFDRGHGLIANHGRLKKWVCPAQNLAPKKTTPQWQIECLQNDKLNP